MNNLGAKIKLEISALKFLSAFKFHRDVKIPPQKTKSCYSNRKRKKEKNFQTEENFNFIRVNALVQQPAVSE